MIISRTPFRVSFFGGGTDYPTWYRDNGGCVISAAINKYCYITCRNLPPFFDYKYRLRYFEREETSSISDIKHPSIRRCLEYMEIKQGVEVVHHADLPAQSGLGSSSTFTVGLLHALHALKGRIVTKRELALGAIHVEQELIKETVGSQDQTAAAFGGFNKINFGGPNEVEVNPIFLSPERFDLFQSHIMLFFTGFSRTASEIAETQLKEIDDHKTELREMIRLVDEAMDLLRFGAAMREIGRLLDEQWKLKKLMSSIISNTHIDQMYETGKRAGAYGGKLLGAGGGGFMLFFVDPEVRENVQKALGGRLYVPCSIDRLGSQIVYYSQGDNRQSD